MKDYTFVKAKQTIIIKFEKALKNLEGANSVLEKLAVKIEEKKVAKGNNKNNTETLESEDSEHKKQEK
ncbi:hypothetical protein ACFC84_03290 [Enterococcus casseliflavus]|uniref:hypothetical protein n=1 Tax=Enterococcus casseliflavus TaxID=37734 RepID=UPI0039A739E7